MRLLDQLELQLEELEAAATEDQLAAEAAAAQTQTVRSFQRKRPVRKPFPDDIERERVVIEAPTSCACCGGSRLAKLGEDITETLEEIPRRFKVIETVREKFTCRDCEAITQPPAPFHATPRGYIGPQLLATILFDKFGLHLPLNRQSRRFKCEGIDLSVSTLADQVGAGVFAAMPLFRADRSPCDRRRTAARRRHHCADPGQGQDGHRADLDLCSRRSAVRRTRIRRRRVYYASRDRCGEHPARHLERFTGILQADAYSGFNTLYDPGRKPAPITPPFVGRTQEGCSSNWPILRRTPGADDRRRRSRQSRWRRSGASICCSTSSATSTA